MMMAYFKSRLPVINKQQLSQVFVRNYCHISSKEIRQIFLNYFIKENDHKFVRSSPVVPFCDPTVAFVNSGMNQFKGIFLGNQTPIYPRVANSQKCIRVGGKHNDLNVVGSDGYHHTFFEMLGNWSFGDYFKKEACTLAWNLLIGPYKLNPNSLYVTYFAGDLKLNLEPDLECKDIWRSIGVPENHIIPFGLKENFWEMGLTGPCGPCTEIHVDHTNSKCRASDVNKDLPDVTELWNLVFIQYNRNVDGSITSLPTQHVDTGMGFERLTALLQRKTNNYDTDIFAGIFDAINNNCRGLPSYGNKFGKDDVSGLDTAYRIFADHTRMLTVCLADGMIPEESQKLRRIIRKVLYLSETVFNQNKNILKEVTNTVIENLGAFYPEIYKNSYQIQNILSYEEEIYKSNRTSAAKKWVEIIKISPNLQNLNVIEMPGLIAAYEELTSSNIRSISPQLAFKIYDSYGLEDETIKLLSEGLGISYTPNSLNKELENVRMRTKRQFISNENKSLIINKLLDMNIVKTNDSFKYDYTSHDGLYTFDDLRVKILSIIQGNEIVDEASSDKDCYLILNQTNLYSEAGGQISDSGTIIFSNDIKFNITNTQDVDGYILHKGTFMSDKKIKTGLEGDLIMNKEDRLNAMANHSAVHLLNASLKYALKNVTCQKSSKVTADYLNFDVGVYGNKLTVEDIEKVVQLIRDVIRNKVDVNIKEINSQQMLHLHSLTLIPGEVYPDTGIRIVEIEDTRNNFVSCEPCCGTHVLNTCDIKDISIINFRSLGRSTTSLTAVTRDRSLLARSNGKKLLERLSNLNLQVKNEESKTKEVSDTIGKIKQKLQENTDVEFIIPIEDKAKCMNVIQEISKQLKSSEREYLRKFVDMEIKSIIEMQQNQSTKRQFVVHYLDCSSILEDVPLQRATKVCPDMPILVISYSNDMVKARCCVPQNMVTETFNAQIWMNNSAVKIFKSSSAPPRGQNEELICNMKEKYVDKINWESSLHKALKVAKKYANEHLK